MAIVNPPGWLENAGPVHTAAQLRSYIGGLLGGTNVTATDLIPRGGVHPNLGGTAGGGGEFLVQAQGSPNMSVRVSPGVCAVPGYESPTQGVYMVMNDAEVSLPVTAAHGSLTRIDSVVVRVRDSDYSGANDDALLEVVAGTAGSGVPPTLTGNRERIADITVGAGVTSITSGNITDRRRFYFGNGAVLQVLNEAELAAIGSAQVGAGQLAWARQQGTLWIFSVAGTWSQISHGSIGSTIYVSKTADTARTSNTSSDDPHLQVNGLPANATYRFELNLIVSAVAVGQGDFGMRFTHPGTGGAYVTAIKHSLFHAAGTAVNGDMDAEATPRTTTSPTGEISGGCGATPSGILVRGKLFTGSSGGNFRLQWRLLQAIGTTTLRQESDMLLTRIS